MEFITAKELKQSQDEFLILDIRDIFNFTQSHIDGSVNIDVYDSIHEGNYEAVKGKLNNLPRDKTIITICNAGITAQSASLILELMGYKTKVLEDGMIGWDY